MVSEFGGLAPFESAINLSACPINLILVGRATSHVTQETFEEERRSLCEGLKKRQGAEGFSLAPLVFIGFHKKAPLALCAVVQIPMLLLVLIDRRDTVFFFPLLCNPPYPSNDS